MELIRYGIFHKEKEVLLGFDVASQDSDFATSVTASLDAYNEERIWLVQDQETAQKAIDEKVDWFNCDYEFPKINEDRNKLEVVKVKIIIEK